AREIALRLSARVPRSVAAEPARAQRPEPALARIAWWSRRLGSRTSSTAVCREDRRGARRERSDQQNCRHEQAASDRPEHRRHLLPSSDLGPRVEGAGHGSLRGRQPPANGRVRRVELQATNRYKRHVLDFRILGPVEVWRDGEPVPLGSSKQRAALALLILEAGRVVSTDRLVDALWGERPPKTAATSLQNFVSRLRKTLGPE